MSRYQTSLPTSYFDAMYAADPDPWDFSASPYEARKYAATLAALRKPRYRRALEIGCSIGVFTRVLAERCDELVAFDVVEGALEEAADRCRYMANVSFEQIRAPDEWPDGCFDLLVLSEVVYYLDRSDVDRLAERASACLEGDGDIILVHWTGETHYPLTGDQAVEAFKGASAGYTFPVFSTRSKEYRLDCLRCLPTASVVQRAAQTPNDRPLYGPRTMKRKY